jgi:hypothetical protein
MGTSNSYGGAGGGKPLIPSWLSNEGGSDDPQSVPPDPARKPQQPSPADDGLITSFPSLQPSVNGVGIPMPPTRPPIPPAGDPKRYTPARNNFTRFVSSRGQDRKSLGRALSHYVSNSSGGSRNAAQRMVVSRGSTARLAGILNSAISGNAPGALRSIGLERLVGRPIEEIFLGLMEIVCPSGGAIDDSIAREAFVETIVDLAQNGITDFDALTAAQVQTILELDIAHAIEARICNDIGTNSITLPQDAKEAEDIQAQLFEFVERSVSDAFAANQVGITMTHGQVITTIDTVYEQAYSILQSMAEAEVDKP